MRNKPPFDLTALATFVEVVARQLLRWCSRSGHSARYCDRHVNVLEQDLGVRLIERTTRSMRVTDAGADLVECAEDPRRRAARER
jgi:hypothetical protein